MTLSDEVEVHLKAAPEMVGKSVALTPKFIDGWENLESKKVYVPTPFILRIHPTYVVMARHKAAGKGLV